MLTALRNCAGALSDLVEIGVPGPFGSGVPDKEAEIETVRVETDPH